MSKSICVAQSVEEIKFILKKIKKEVFFLPLDLSTQVYCINNNIKYYNPINLVTKNFHEDTLIHSKKLIDEIIFNSEFTESHKKEFKAIIRFRFHSIAFLLELIEQLKKRNKINEIIVSGWDRYFDQYSKKNHFISYLVLNLIDDIKITTLENCKYFDYSKNKNQELKIINSSLDENKNYILLTNLGYNFLRIVLNFKKKGKMMIVPLFDKINPIKKTIYKFLGVTFIKMQEIKSQTHKEVELPEINFNYKNKDLSKVLNFRAKQEKLNFIKLHNQSKAIDDFFKKMKINLVITNFTKGIHGYFVDLAKKKNINSICIPHGTLSKNFNNYDKIYKETISEAITSLNSTYHVSQSFIAKEYFKNTKNNKVINTGNILFSENKKNRKGLKKILFAVTMKDFESIQILGVEMYYEFLDNLLFLNKMAQNNNLQFLIKLHPINYDNFNDLKKIFKNLEFSKDKITKALNKVFATISFSSSAIEDALNSNCPVILLDRWKRYQHCDAESDIKKRNIPLYYVNEEKDLIECINTISKSDKIDFTKYISQSNFKANINNLFNNF